MTGLLQRSSPSVHNENDVFGGTLGLDVVMVEYRRLDREISPKGEIYACETEMTDCMGGSLNVQTVKNTGRIGLAR